MKIIDKLKELLPRITKDPVLTITTEEDDYTQLDPQNLKQAYREKPFIKAIVNISANFVFSAPPKIKSQDQKAEELLNKIYLENIETLIQTARETSLTGNGYLKIDYDVESQKIDFVNIYPSKVSIIPDVKDLRKYQQITIYHQIPLTYDSKITNIQEIYTPQETQIYINDRPYQTVKNPAGEIPVLHIAYNRMSNELYGTGDINEAVYKAIVRYERLLEAVVKNYQLHAHPTIIFFSSTEGVEEVVKNTDWTKSKGFVLPQEDKVQLIEPQNILQGAKDILQLIFYNIVILSETPEFLMGVHQPSSWASTKEQMHPIIRKTKRYQNIWKQALKKANRIILKLLEEYEGLKFTTYDTDIEFPEIQTDKLKEYAQTISQLVASGILTTEEAKKAIIPYLPTLIEELTEEQINNFEKEAKNEANKGT